MHIKSTVVGVLGLVAVLSAGAATINVDLGPYTLSYDDANPLFGAPSYSYSSGGGVSGFAWYLPAQVQVVSEGLPALGSFDLPSFTVTANPGWALSGTVTGFIGNLVFNEFKGSTDASVAGSVSINGGPAQSFTENLVRTVTASGGNFSSGYYAASGSLPLGGFTSLSFSGTLTLNASSQANSFASIIAQAQNEMKVGLVANPVPEPETYALMLAGLGVLGALARRRQV